MCKDGAGSHSISSGSIAKSFRIWVKQSYSRLLSRGIPFEVLYLRENSFLVAKGAISRTKMWSNGAGSHSISSLSIAKSSRIWVKQFYSRFLSRGISSKVLHAREFLVSPAQGRTRIQSWPASLSRLSVFSWGNEVLFGSIQLFWK